MSNNTLFTRCQIRPFFQQMSNNTLFHQMSNDTFSLDDLPTPGESLQQHVKVVLLCYARGQFAVLRWRPSVTQTELTLRRRIVRQGNLIIIMSVLMINFFMRGRELYYKYFDMSEKKNGCKLTCPLSFYDILAKPLNVQVL